MNLALIICSTVPIIFFYDVGPFRGNGFGLCLEHFVRDRGGMGYWLFFWRVYWLVQMGCNLGKKT